MFASSFSSKVSFLLIIGLVFLLLMSFLSCSQDPIFDPRYQDEEDEQGKNDEKEDPGHDTGGGVGILEIRSSGHAVFLV